MFEIDRRRLAGADEIFALVRMKTQFGMAVAFCDECECLSKFEIIGWIKMMDG